MEFPKLIRIQQKVYDKKIEDTESYFRAKFVSLNLENKIKKGETVAITAGSRGIADIVTIIKTLVLELKKIKAKPFIIPSMGSHGGATSKGQEKLLSKYGITESSINAPIYSSMDTIRIGDTKNGIPVYFNKIAYIANHIIVVNRIKAHTEFFGEIESGLTKMLVIGLGKHKGATTAHSYAVKFGYEKTLLEIGDLILQKAPVSLGVGLIENGHRQLSQIEFVTPKDFINKEKYLLSIAKKNTAKIPFNNIDILIVDEAGKDISGTGMDTKVIGRIRNIYEKELTSPKITRIILRDITDKTEGNAIGIGLADFITKSLFDKIDLESTFINTVTAITPEKGMIPLVCNSDKEAIESAISTSGPLDSKKIKIVRIKNTSVLDEMYISEGLIKDAMELDNINIIGKAKKINFDEKNNIID
ncbi:MAG: lactate racemase domain-containing protein [Eubacteriaceae bacterium]